MKFTHEDTNLVITALQDMRANLYINNNLEEMHKVSKVIKGIENEMESKDVSQKKIMISDGTTEVGSETGMVDEDDEAVKDKNENKKVAFGEVNKLTEAAELLLSPEGFSMSFVKYS